MAFFVQTQGINMTPLVFLHPNIDCRVLHSNVYQSKNQRSLPLLDIIHQYGLELQQTII